MEKIEVALIGCGYWGSKLKGYIEGAGPLNLAMVCNSKSNLGDVWLNDAISAVVVATPMATHYEIVKAALVTGKSVLCAKPLALRTAECEELKELAGPNGARVLVDFTYTFSQALNQARVLIKSREIGKVLGFDMMLRQWGRFAREDVYWLLASHLLAILDMFLPIEGLTFSKREFISIDNQAGAALLPFKGKGEIGLLNVSIGYPGKEARVVVYGEEGTIVYQPLTQPCLRFRRYDGKHNQFYIDEANNLALVIEAFVEMLQGYKSGNVDRAVAVTRVINQF